MITIPKDNQTRSQFDAYIGMDIRFSKYFASYQFAFESLIDTIYQSNMPVDIKKLYGKNMILLTYTADLFADYTNIADYVEDIYEQEL